MDRGWPDQDLEQTMEFARRDLLAVRTETPVNETQ